MGHLMRLSFSRRACPARVQFRASPAAKYDTGIRNLSERLAARAGCRNDQIPAGILATRANIPRTEKPGKIAAEHTAAVRPRHLIPCGEKDR
jgi:hypothetical protein